VRRAHRYAESFTNLRQVELLCPFARSLALPGVFFATKLSALEARQRSIWRAPGQRESACWLAIQWIDFR
jgi:hypothetical protein